MRDLLRIGLAILFTSIGALGQGENKTTCPSISLRGPEGVTRQGDRLKVKAELAPFEQANLRYKWSIDKGTIISERESSEIVIDSSRIEMDEGKTGTNMTVTLEISGLPAGCLSQVSDT